VEFRDIPEHEHSHSLYVYCLNCHTFGINLPTRFMDAAECGNCRSMETVKYYPSCCIMADRDNSVPLAQVEPLIKTLEYIVSKKQFIGIPKWDAEFVDVAEFALANWENGNHD
jgi:hypothetical protein